LASASFSYFLTSSICFFCAACAPLPVGFTFLDSSLYFLWTSAVVKTPSSPQVVVHGAGQLLPAVLRGAADGH
jgi:hypothetical protein